MEIVVRRIAAVVVTASFALTACASGTDGAEPSSSAPSTAAPTTPPPVPGRSWATAPPQSVGLDPRVLEQVAHSAEVGHSNCLAVVRDGKLAFERSFQGTGPTTTQAIFSATKSITSVLVGIAIDDGDLRVTDRASRWIPEWRGTPSAAVTVRDLLSNDSGRFWSLASDYGSLIRAHDQTAYAVGLDQAAAPGTVWAYNNAAILTLQRVLEGATGEDTARFAEERLFRPLGMEDTTMGRDGAGNVQTYMGVRSTCRDLARFGVLALHQGRWGRTRVVSARWFRESTGRSSQELNAAYGYLWWLNREGRLASPTAAVSLAGAADRTERKGQLVPGAPDDLFWALGLGNQLVQVDPGSGTVVVRLGTFVARPQPPTFGPTEASKVVTEAVVR